MTSILARHTSADRHAPLQILASSWWPRPGYGPGSLESRDPSQRHYRQTSTVTELARANCTTGAYLSCLYMPQSTLYNVSQSCYRCVACLLGHRHSFGYSCSTKYGSRDGQIGQSCERVISRTAAVERSLHNAVQTW